jgi:hypothetical protein
MEVSIELVELVVGRSCGLAETENPERSRVIKTAKMVDFIMVWYNGRGGLYGIVLGRSKNHRF